MGLLAACDAICMLGGWEGSAGVNREYGFALARGMGIYKESQEAAGWTNRYYSSIRTRLPG